MLETILGDIHNYFPIPNAQRAGTFQIVSGTLKADFLMKGQYYRIMGSVFNDGLHRYEYDGIKDETGSGNDVHPDMRELKDETFTGYVIPLAIPYTVIELAHEIKLWRENNPDTDKVSESFGGYSYSRAQSTTNGTSTSGGWKAVFGDRLNKWRRPYD